MKKAKLIVTTLMALALGAAVLGPAGCGSQQEHNAAAAQQYTCPMHPDVVQDKAGKCPKCGMDLTPKK